LRVLTRARLRALLLGLLVCSGAEPGAASDEPPPRPPVFTSGLPLGGGAELFRHGGVNRPPDAEGVRWGVSRVGRRRFAGRDVDVLGYAAETDPGAGPVPRVYAQADFVDPATGEVVGGLDGWGKEGYADEGEAPLPCPGR
jgi:hypothetical protein